MRSTSFKISISAMVFASMLSFSSSATTADSVKQRLDARAIKHEIDADGDFKITYSYKKENRTQLVFVSHKTESVKNFVIREIFF